LRGRRERGSEEEGERRRTRARRERSRKIFPTNEIAQNKICSFDLLNGHEWRKVGCVVENKLEFRESCNTKCCKIRINDSKIYFQTKIQTIIVGGTKSGKEGGSGIEVITLA